MTRRVKILLVGLAILSGIGALVLLSPSQDAVLERNLAVLREHHPETAERLAEAEAMLEVRFEVARLPGDALATTLIREDRATIRVDLRKIQERREWPIPALAHEVYHAWDATRLGPSRYIAEANASRAMPWHTRPHEVRALAWENATRQALRASHPNLYRAMPERRTVHGDTP